MDFSKFAPKGSILDDFLNGIAKGLLFVLISLIPAMIMAFSLINILNITGLMPMISKVFNPVMGIFGLPGETGVALVTGWLNTPSGLAICIDLCNQGVISAAQLAIMIPIMWSCGSCLQMTGRVLAVCKLDKKYYFPVYIISWIAAFAIGIIGRICNAIFF